MTLPGSITAYEIESHLSRNQLHMSLWYDKRYGTYRYIWRENGRQRMKSLGKDREVARIKAREMDRRRALGELAPMLVRGTVEEHLRWFMQYHLAKKRKKTQDIYKFALKKIMAFLDEQHINHLDELTRNLWEMFESALFKDGYSVETRNDIYTVLSVFLNLAVQNNLIMKNPLVGVRRRLKNPRRRLPDVFTEEQIGKLRTASPPYFIPVIDLILLTGLRRGEIWALEWEDIDLKKRTLTVQAKPDLGHIPKDYELRSIDLSDQAVKVLSSLPSRGSFVFDTGKGNPAIAMDTMTHIFSRTRKEAGLKEGSLHSLRRTYATKLELAGASLRYIQSQLGHESLSTTQKYLNPSGEIQKERVSGLRYEALD